MTSRRDLPSRIRRGGARAPVLLALVAVFGACEGAEQVVDHYRGLTPHEAYLQSLRDAGLAETALGREWVDAAQQALERPHAVEIPFREEGFIAPEDPDAVGYGFSLERGKVLSVQVEVLSGEDGERPRLFLDLFRVPADSADPLRPVVTADSVAGGLVYEPYRSGDYVLRLQPELLRGGRYRVTLTLDAALAFPVEGEDVGAVQSFFGAPRDAGRRSHHGIDIFATRGTPVLAAAAGRVARANETPRGGRVVWLRDSRRRQSLYYAHLDSQAVRRGARVSVGDTLGFVGNTGNARTTPPHLHFGIYRRGEGPVDPLPFVETPRGSLAPLTADLEPLGRWARVRENEIRLRASPSLSADVVSELDRFTPFRVMAGVGAWYRVRLPDGGEGFVAARLTEAVDRPIRSAVAEASGRLHAWPDTRAPVVMPVAHGTALSVLGEYRGFLLVEEEPTGRRGWVVAED